MLGLCAHTADPVLSPGLRVRDLFADQLTCKFSSVGDRSKEEHAKALKARRKVLDVAFRGASSAPDSIALVCNVLVPLSHSSLQAVAAWDIWKEGKCIARDWTAVGLATSDDAESAAVAGAVASIRHLVGELSSTHAFTDPENTMKHFADTSLHSAVQQSETVLDVLYPWWEENPDTTVVLHHVPDSVGFQEHNLVHMRITTIWTEAGSALVRTYDFARRAITANMLSSWKCLAQVKKFIGASFYWLRIGPKLSTLSPSHIKNGPWLSKMGGSNFSTARMARVLTSHAPISSYRAQFKLGPEECSCPGSPPKTFAHVYMHCPLYVREGAAKH